ncbi:NucA/NucB deoxyribonuclease domain-containing protein [Streptomyces sp. KR55]|uniref:NucA/NucB deoxyribonuclease domain-containing protein n=1 Tax=Streptomyces sp. KR55 TaxID=3457425 RepID=UPI003FCF7431
MLGSRYPLHRPFDQALQTANRNVACGPDVPRPPNRPDLSCDEYPFAQTYEGASRNPDYSCHFLDRQDNSREESLRRAFLNSLRTLENDAFYVEVTGKESATAPAPPSARGPVGCGSD